MQDLGLLPARRHSPCRGDLPAIQSTQPASKYSTQRAGSLTHARDSLTGHLACRTNTSPRYVDAWQSKDLHEGPSPMSDWIATVLAQNRTIGAFGATASQPRAKAPSRRSGAAEAPADTCPVATLGDYRFA